MIFKTVISLMVLGNIDGQNTLEMELSLPQEIDCKTKTKKKINIKNNLKTLLKQ